MIKIVAIILSVILAGVLIVRNLPKRVIHESSSTQFVMDCPFADIQKGMRQGKFEQETLKINNAEVLGKEWIDKHFNVQRPLRKDRYWEFSGRLIAKVRVTDSRIGAMEVELIEDIFFAKDRIEIKTQLAHPLPIGVSDLLQEIIIYPEGNKTVVELNSDITLKRYVPWFLADSARKQVKSATEESIVKMESAIRGLKGK
jgi:hypothetical protein